MYGTLFSESNFVVRDVLDKSPFHYFTSLDQSFRRKLSKAAASTDKLYEKVKASQLEAAYEAQWEQLLKRSKLAK